MLTKILSVLNVISQVVLAIVAVISLITAYVMFAPDDLPKPFHLLYDTGNGVPAAVSAGTVGTTTTIVVTATPAPIEPEYKPGEGVMLNMSTKIINLVDPSGRKYIRLTVVVEFAPDDPKFPDFTAEEKTTYLTAFNTKLTALLPIMDDTVITLLSTKTYDDLYTADGKEKLRLEIMDILTKKLPDLKIISIYFTEFVVQ